MKQLFKRAMLSVGLAISLVTVLGADGSGAGVAIASEAGEARAGYMATCVAAIGTSEATA